VSEPKKRPGFWWLLFYGRRRRGVPWVLLGLFLAVLVFALLFAVPGGDDASRAVEGLFLGLLLGGTATAIVVAAFFSRRRR